MKLNPELTSKWSNASFPYRKKPSQLINMGIEEYEKFISGVESNVRNDIRYTEYIAKLKSSGYNNCVILGKIKGEKVNVEMHHGPMFTLYDICDIIVRYLSKTNDEPINSFDIAKLVIEEHRLDHVQVVMVSEIPHKAAHLNLLFIHTLQSFGRIDYFIEKYHKGLDDSHEYKIRKYIKLCKKYKNTIDNGLFDTGERLSFKKK